MKYEELKPLLLERGMTERNAESIGKFPFFDEYENALDFLESFTGRFISKHPGNKRTILYIHEALDTKRLRWEDFTSVNLTKCKNFMKDKVSPNSLRTYFAQINALLKPYVDDGIVKCKSHNTILTSKKVPADKIALTAAEVNSFWEFRNQLGSYDYRYSDIWRDFMLCTYLGCRHSDLTVISRNNITTAVDIDGNNIGVVEYTSVKTQVKAFPPLHPHVLELLAMPRTSTVYANCTSERILKRIARTLGIDQEKTLFTCGKRVTAPKWKFMSTHVARHTFATLLVGGRNPISIEEVAKYMGHTNTTQTLGYVVRDEMPFSTNVMSNFDC